MQFQRRMFPLAATAFAAVLALGAASAFAQKGETVKIAWIDPLTGLMAPVGQNQVKSFQFFADKVNNDPKLNPAGVKFEIVPIDNKLSPTESLNALKAAIDQGVRYITQGNGSSVATRSTSTTSATPARKCSTSTTRPSTPTSPTASAAPGTSASTPTPP